MKKILASLLLCVATLANSQTTTFTANLKTLVGDIPTAYVELSLKNCAGSGSTPTIPHVNGVGVLTFPVNLYPDPTTGLVSDNPFDETAIVCGSSTGVAYYHIRVVQGDAVRTLIKKVLFEDDFDVQGSTFSLNSATPRSGAVITPPVATAVLTNPAGNQTIVQPVGTALSINHLSAGFAQSANGADMIPANRFTDTTPTGNFLNFKNAALSASLFKVDVQGNVTATNIPAGTINTGTGTTNKISKWTTGASGIQGDSSLSDNGTTVATSESISLLNAGASPATIANDTAGGINITSNGGKVWEFANAGSLSSPSGGAVQFNGATSGSITVNAPSAAGSNNLTLPAATDTLLGRATTDTLTNKTLTSPSISSPSTTGTDSGTETLTNKTLTSPALTTPAIGSAGATLAGSTSGTITVKAPATAGANTATFPAATGNVVLDSTIPAVILQRVGQDDQTAKSTNITSTSIGTTLASGRYTWNIAIGTTATDASGATYAYSIIWTQDGISRSFSLSGLTFASTAQQSTVTAGIFVDNATSVSYSVTVTGTPTTGRYGVHAWTVKN
jgi:hypothetical protein